MRHFFVILLLLLQCTLTASSDSERPKNNPLWQELFDSEIESYFYINDENGACLIFIFEDEIDPVLTAPLKNAVAFCPGIFETSFFKLYFDKTTTEDKTPSAVILSGQKAPSQYLNSADPSESSHTTTGKDP